MTSGERRGLTKVFEAWWKDFSQFAKDPRGEEPLCREAFAAGALFGGESALKWAKRTAQADRAKASAAVPAPRSPAE